MRAYEVAQILLASKRPLFHIGNGVRNAIEEFNAVKQATGIPFVTARNGNDLADGDDPLCIGRPGTFAQRGANFCVQIADLYVAIGTRLALTQTGYNTKDYARNAKIIQVDVDQPELDKGTLRDPIKIRQDAKAFLTELMAGLQGYPLPDWSAWLKRCQSLRDRFPVVLPEYREESGYVNAYHFIDVLSQISDSQDVIVTDMGQAFQITHQTWRVKKGQFLATNGGLAPMGWGLPAAIGACIGTGRRTICITGDGGLMMNIQELATVAHHHLPIKIFVLNNGGYSTIKQTQELGFGGRLMGVNHETGLSFPDFKYLALNFGFAAQHVETHYDLKMRVQMGLEVSGHTLTEIYVNPDQPQAPRAVNRRNPDGTMNPTRLEDMHPFLDAAEIEEIMKL